MRKELSGPGGKDSKADRLSKCNAATGAIHTHIRTRREEDGRSISRCIQCHCLYKKKSREFVLPGFGELVKQKKKAHTGINPKTQHV
jgi:nucleoid DNA-binding protein